MFALCSGLLKTNVYGGLMETWASSFFFSCSSSFLSVCGKGVGWGGLLKESCSLALQFYGVEGI